MSGCPQWLTTHLATTPSDYAMDSQEQLASLLDSISTTSWGTTQISVSLPESDIVKSEHIKRPRDDDSPQPSSPESGDNDSSEPQNKKARLEESLNNFELDALIGLPQGVITPPTASPDWLLDMLMPTPAYVDPYALYYGNMVQQAVQMQQMDRIAQLLHDEKPYNMPGAQYLQYLQAAQISAHNDLSTDPTFQNQSNVYQQDQPQDLSQVQTPVVQTPEPSPPIEIFLDNPSPAPSSIYSSPSPQPSYPVPSGSPAPDISINPIPNINCTTLEIVTPTGQDSPDAAQVFSNFKTECPPTPVMSFEPLSFAIPSSECIPSIHARPKNTSCNVCGKKYESNYKLKIHMFSHTGERPFTCDVCGAGFTRRPNLMAHQRVHTGVKAYPCTRCERSFGHPSDRLAHVLSEVCIRASKHIQVKPDGGWLCVTCNQQSFNSELQAERHARTHEAGRSKTCPVCREAFKGRKAHALVRHVREYHPEYMTSLGLK